MVNVQRQNLMDSAAPNPSVETLLHAFLPHKFVDHTHSVAACVVADQSEADALCREIWGARVGLVPYVMPGFALARAAADAYEADASVEGLILLKHGVFSFGATAKESYERMIALVAEAERFIAGRDASLASVSIPTPLISIETQPLTSPQRGEVDAAPAAAGEGVPGHPERASPPSPGAARRALAFVASSRLIATTGNVVTVDGGAVEAMLR